MANKYLGYHRKSDKDTDVLILE